MGRKRQHSRGEEGGNQGYRVEIDLIPRLVDEIASADTTRDTYGRPRPAEGARIFEDTISPDTSKLIWTSRLSWVHPKY
jgi:hypothetical protein